MLLQNKTAVITGASSGIGQAIAIKFAMEGAKVCINYNNNYVGAQNTLAECNKYTKGSITVKADVSKEEEVKILIDTVAKELGSIDILVNNAGIVFDKPWIEKTVDDWQKTLMTNLVGAFLTAKYAFPFLKESKAARIINISSTNATNAYSPEAMDYDASKAGMVSLTKDLARALSPNILVNAILPGWVKTPINKDLPADYVKQETESIFVERFAEPNEIAEMALFLASENSSFVNGSIIEVDGGYQ